MHGMWILQNSRNRRGFMYTRRKEVHIHVSKKLFVNTGVYIRTLYIFFEVCAFC